MYQIHCKLHPLINIISGLWTDFLKVKNLRKYAPKRSKLHHSQKHFGEACPQTPLANAWLRNGSQALSPQKIVAPPPLANPAYAYELLLRNLFENPSWQTTMSNSHSINIPYYSI